MPASSEDARRRRFTRSPINQHPEHPGYHCTGDAWSYSTPADPSMDGRGNHCLGVHPKSTLILGAAKHRPCSGLHPTTVPFASCKTFGQDCAPDWYSPMLSDTHVLGHRQDQRPTMWHHAPPWPFPRRGWRRRKLFLFSAAVAVI